MMSDVEDVEITGEVPRFHVKPSSHKSQHETGLVVRAVSSSDSSHSVNPAGFPINTHMLIHIDTCSNVGLVFLG